MSNLIKLNFENYSHKITREFVKAQSLSIVEKEELLSLLNTSYPHWNIENIFDRYPDYEQLYIYRMRFNETLIASRQLLLVNNLITSPIWAKEMAHSLSINNFAIGSRVIVHPDFRKNGLGTHLVEHVNHEAYSRFEVEGILGSSTSLAAISLYLRLGAKLWKDDIQNISSDHTMNINNASLYNILNKNNLSRTRMSFPLRYIYSSNRQENECRKNWNHNLVSTNIQTASDKVISS
ncbi:MAG: GNAT family N-acetyltransferase [Gammaproteobacteria bacterium]|nr:GNAT family N-acetyltransferase [Gammaproteobacteria bacterium]